MSWNIYVYAEVKKKESKEWEPLTDKCVCDDFKYYKDEFYDENMYKMYIRNVVHPIVKSFIENGDDDSTVKHCRLEDLKIHYFNKVKLFKERIDCACKALGVSTDIEDVEEYSSDNNYKLTIPVNKELITDLLFKQDEISNALQVIGMCDTISSMTNYGDDIRLLFVEG